MGKQSIADAIATLTEALKSDHDYREAWKANIAVQFQDEFTRQIRPVIHEISNKAADEFLKLLGGLG